MKMSFLKKTMLLIPVILLAGCSGNNGNNTNNEEKGDPSFEPTATFVDVKPITYTGAKTETDMAKFYSETKKSNGSSWDDPLNYGFVPSVWHTLTINDVNVPVYSTRCGNNVHSFAYVDIDTDGTFELKAKVELLEGSYKQAIILPQKSNVSVKISNNIRYSFSLRDYGDYTLCFGSSSSIKPEKALTIYVAKETKDVVPSGYNVQTIEPGTYDDNDSTKDIPSLRFNQSKTYYRFKKGKYIINSVLIPNDSIVYFEPGVWFEIHQDTSEAAFSNSGTKMKILGRCLVDFSKVMGGDSKTKSAFDFKNLTDGAYVEGFVSINSNTWTMCYTNCDNLEIAHNMLFGYRTYSDGIMLSGCMDCNVHHNFVRSGDDAIEAKATSARKLQSNNLVYEYNSVWTDKAKAYGVIYESNANVTNVYFRHNSIGFAQTNWHAHCGCLEIQMGTEYSAVWSNIYFEDFEIYYTANSVMNIWNAATNIYSYGDPAARTYGGTIKNIYYKDIVVNRMETTNSSVPPYMLAINYIVDSAHPEYIDHLSLGKIYVDNVYYQNTLLTKENYSTLSKINVPQELGWSTGNIKWNTL